MPHVIETMQDVHKRISSPKCPITKVSYDAIVANQFGEISVTIQNDGQNITIIDGAKSYTWTFDHEAKQCYTQAKHGPRHHFNYWFFVVMDIPKLVQFMFCQTQWGAK